MSNRALTLLLRGRMMVSSVCLPTALWTRLDRLAQEREMSRSRVVRMLLMEALEFESDAETEGVVIGYEQRTA